MHFLKIIFFPFFSLESIYEDLNDSSPMTEEVMIYYRYLNC